MEQAEDLGKKIEAVKGNLSSSDMNRFIKIQTKLANAARGAM
jgi:hypothetical protein